MIPETELVSESKNKFKFRRGFKTWAEKISLEFRYKLNSPHYSRLCAFELAEYLQVDILVPQDIKGFGAVHVALLNMAWSALTMKDDEGKNIIIHNGAHSAARQQSDLMHELAHIVCNHPLDDRDNRAGFPMLRTYNEEHELEANWLGGCLQLPRPSLVHAMRSRMSLDAICDFYQASREMVQYRLNITGIKKQFNYKFNK